ncbi:MAG: MBL fold metallo-hydrolase [Betaproteobacteria bacterium]|nr:MBL fold metallo-hydrolase [Betaproteobacteria bacterium]
MGWRWVVGLCLLMLVPDGRVHAFEGMRVILLGTGAGALSAPERAGPAVLIETGKDVLLFDCGRGVAQRLAQATMALGNITQVFITHLHADNTLGCADLWWSGLMRGRDEPLSVIGPEGTQKMMDHTRQAYSLDVHSRGLGGTPGALFQVAEINDNMVYESDSVRVRAFVVDHGDMKPAYGYRIDNGRHTVVISGGARFSENLAENAKGAGVLIHEYAAVDKELLADSPALQREFATHSTVEDVIKTARTARPALTVLSPLEFVQIKDADAFRAVRSQFPGSIELGYDLMVIEMQNEIQHRGSPSDRAFAK